VNLGRGPERKGKGFVKKKERERKKNVGATSGGGGATCLRGQASQKR